MPRHPALQRLDAAKSRVEYIMSSLANNPDWTDDDTLNSLDTIFAALTDTATLLETDPRLSQ